MYLALLHFCSSNIWYNGLKLPTILVSQCNNFMNSEQEMNSKRKLQLCIVHLIQWLRHSILNTLHPNSEVMLNAEKKSSPKYFRSYLSSLELSVTFEGK